MAGVDDWHRICKGALCGPIRRKEFNDASHSLHAWFRLYVPTVVRQSSRSPADILIVCGIDKCVPDTSLSGTHSHFEMRRSRSPAIAITGRRQPSSSKSQQSRSVDFSSFSDFSGLWFGGLKNLESPNRNTDGGADRRRQSRPLPHSERFLRISRRSGSSGLHWASA